MVGLSLDCNANTCHNDFMPYKDREEQLAYFKRVNSLPHRINRPRGTPTNKQRRKYAKTWRERYPEKYAESQRKSYLRRKAKYYTVTKAQRRASRYNLKCRIKKYGLSIPDFEKLLEKQNFKCASCKDVISEEKSHIDHDHKTNQVRGLLCSLCNSGLGLFLDNPTRLRQAAEYVEKTR